MRFSIVKGMSTVYMQKPGWLCLNKAYGFISAGYCCGGRLSAPPLVREGRFKEQIIFCYHGVVNRL